MSVHECKLFKAVFIPNSLDKWKGTLISLKVKNLSDLTLTFCWHPPETEGHGSSVLTQETQSKLVTTQWFSAQVHLKKILVCILVFCTLAYSYFSSSLIWSCTNLSLSLMFSLPAISTCVSPGFIKTIKTLTQYSVISSYC